MSREKVKRNKTTTMLLVERATTTAAADRHSRRQQTILPPIHKPKEVDVDYIQALKVCFLTCLHILP